MILAVLDTNTLASGTLIASTSPGQILNAWHGGKFELITSEHILNELVRTLQKPYFQTHIDNDTISDFIDLVRNEATVTQIVVNVGGVATHPEDDLILAAAISAEADYLVTGDKHFLKKVGNTYQKVKLISPIDFLDLLNKPVAK